MAEDVEALARALIARASVTPDDAGCQSLIAERLGRAGYVATLLKFGEVENILLWRGPSDGLLFLGHTDVVPPGPAAQWLSPPFEPTVHDGLLFGRGAADMKGSVAAMVIVLEGLAADGTADGLGVGLLLTADEEGPAQDGVRRVAPWLAANQRVPRYCIVGEPTASRVLGDTVRVGRRGSLSAKLTVRGVQGHVAYPQLLVNPIHKALEPLATIADLAFADGDADFPATTLQFTAMAAGVGADNVVPGDLSAAFNARFSPRQSFAGLEARIEALLDAADLDYTIDWHRSGEPYRTVDGSLRQAVRDACQAELGIAPVENSAGGTSDGRFIAPLGVEVVELGPINATIHKVNECIALADLHALPGLYTAIARRLISK